MKHIIRRGLVFTLVMCMIFNVASISASAMERSPSVNLSQYDERKMELIERERELMYQDLVSQLEKQDALDKIDRFMFLIDDAINAKYSSQRASNFSIYAPYGGWYSCDNSSYSLETRYYSVVAAAQLGKMSKPHLLDAAGVLFAFVKPSEIVTVIGKTIAVLSGLRMANAFIASMMWDEITLGRDAVMIVATYDKLDLKTTEVVWRWPKNPYMEVTAQDLVAYGTFTKKEDEDFIKRLGG